MPVLIRMDLEKSQMTSGTSDASMAVQDLPKAILITSDTLDGSVGVWDLRKSVLITSGVWDAFVAMRNLPKSVLISGASDASLAVRDLPS